MRHAILAAAMTAISPGLSLAQDWSGGYAGVHFGGIDVGTNIDLSEADLNFGVRAGYRLDLGDWTLGAELGYDRAGLDLAPGTEIEGVVRAKANLGIDLGNVMPYVTAGGARAFTSFGDGNGWVAGAGVVYLVSPSVEVGGEILYHDFEDIADSGIDAQATTYMVQLTLRF